MSEKKAKPHFADDPIEALDEKQAAALEELQGLLKDEIAGHESLYDKYYLWRYLKAREYKAADAVIMFRDTQKWRAEYDVEARAGDDYAASGTSDENEVRQLLLKHVPMQIHGVDKRGCPIYVERMGSVDVEGLMAVATEEQITLHHVYQLEAMERKKQSGKFLKHVVIEDLTGLGWSHFNTKFLGIGKRIVHIDESHYPEVAGKLYVINAPWLFSALWNIVKPWLAARTIAKIEICGANYQEALAADVELAQLPREFGGTCACGAGGDGRCLSAGERFPESAYRHNKPHEAGSDAVSVTVPGRGKHEVKLRVEHAQTFMAYEFWTESNDISFAVEFEAHSTAAESAKSVRMPVEPTRRVESHKQHIHGTFTAPQPGIYVLVFDNSYSMFTSKKLTFRVMKEDPEDIK